MSWRFRLFKRKEAESRLGDEIRFHLEQEAQLRQERGEAPEQAALNARRDLGNVSLVKEVTRQAWGWILIEDLARDLRHSLRMLARSPLFALWRSYRLRSGSAPTPRSSP